MRSDLPLAMSRIGVGLGVGAAAYALSGLHLRSLFSFLLRAAPRSDGWQLDFAPTEIGWADRAFLLLFGVLPKAVRSVLGHGLRVQGRDEIELPRLELRCPVRIGDEQKAAYRKSLGAAEWSEVGAKEFVLAAVTNQLMLLLVVHPRLPVSPLGAVNVRNRIEFHATFDTDQPLTAHASVGGNDNLARVTRRGVELDIHIDVFAASSASQLVMRQIITILALGPSTPRSNAPPPAESLDRSQKDANYTSAGMIKMHSASPRAWCRVCGDYNPIHVSSLLARLFGFRGKIAHGNHVVAHTLHLVSSASGPSLVREITDASKGRRWWIEMHFRRPMVLPLQLAAQIAADNSEVEWRCNGAKDDKVYVQGSIGAL